MDEKWFEDVLTFWKTLMDDPKVDLKDRMKASENLAKALGGQESADGLAPLAVRVDYGEP